MKTFIRLFAVMSLLSQNPIFAATSPKSDLCPAESSYDKTSGLCLAGEILTQGVLHSEGASEGKPITIKTRDGTYELMIDDKDEIARLERADGLYFEVDGSLVKFFQEDGSIGEKIIVKYLAWLE